MSKTNNQDYEALLPSDEGMNVLIERINGSRLWKNVDVKIRGTWINGRGRLDSVDEQYLSEVNRLKESLFTYIMKYSKYKLDFDDVDEQLHKGERAKTIPSDVLALVINKSISKYDADNPSGASFLTYFLTLVGYEAKKYAAKESLENKFGGMTVPKNFNSLISQIYVFASKIQKPIEDFSDEEIASMSKKLGVSVKIIVERLKLAQIANSITHLDAAVDESTDDSFYDIIQSDEKTPEDLLTDTESTVCDVILQIVNAITLTLNPDQKCYRMLFYSLNMIVYLRDESGQNYLEIKYIERECWKAMNPEYIDFMYTTVTETFLDMMQNELTHKAQNASIAEFKGTSAANISQQYKKFMNFGREIISTMKNAE